MQQRQADSVHIRRSINMSSCDGALVDIGALYTPFPELNQVSLYSYSNPLNVYSTQYDSSLGKIISLSMK